MKYKFKVNDKVRIKAGVDLSRISICKEENQERLTSQELLITRATPGNEGWMDSELNGIPTYTVRDERCEWRIPEIFIGKSRRKYEQQPMS